MTVGVWLFLPVEVPSIIEVKGAVQYVDTRITKHSTFKITVNGTTYAAEKAGAQRALDKTAINYIAIGDDAVLAYEKGTNNLRSLTVNDTELFTVEEWMRQEQIDQRIIGVISIVFASVFAMLGVFVVREHIYKE